MSKTKIWPGTPELHEFIPWKNTIIEQNVAFMMNGIHVFIILMLNLNSPVFPMPHLTLYSYVACIYVGHCKQIK